MTSTGVHIAHEAVATLPHAQLAHGQAQMATEAAP